ncbi:SusD/RagB family nutrient-binding outer membrane lipoprotein [Chitinophaga sp. S165]|uniref:SusD/RagB family nutrient-binding outer membrane lipoprotein n=1 Tax=Chitinophaga sp. S165 TaxID=2135462 RepID=UPI001304FC41|nr:SusD/RagB family nutrient-binding outer membrane lipoprotein [Chitinophaga sp. S165]
MKKLIINISCLIGLVLGIAGCSSQLDDYYVDPDKTTNPTIEKLFSGILENNRIRPQYWEIRTMSATIAGAYCQTATIDNSAEDRYFQNAGHVEGFWNDFYRPSNQSSNPADYNTGNGVMAQYRTMQRLYGVLPLDERPNVQVFMMAGRALLLDQTAQMIDLFGDIPFTEAGSLDYSNTISNAKFQDQKELYDTILIGLKDVAEWFAGTTLNSSAEASFKSQDYLMGGSLDKWRRYINSIRLRYLMRISFVDEERAKAEVAEILSNPIFYPLVDGDGVGDNYNPLNTDVLLQQFNNYTDNLRNVFTETRAIAAPDYMLNTVMLPANDPRIPFMFDKNTNKGKEPNKTYRAMKYNETKQADSLTYCSIMDSSVFVFNSRLPGVYVSAAETNFLKAEAFERGFYAGSAQAAYELGIRQAIAFMYYLYNTSTSKYEALTQPSTATVSAFLTQPSVAYAGDQATKLDRIWTQKWLHFNMLQSRQAWAEWRRTGSPKITTFPSPRPGYELPPNRLLYPTSEVAYNSSYSEVKAKDTRDAKIFWMKE